MKILLTGASSFTGAWFAHELANSGNEVVATLRGRVNGYSGTRGERVAWLSSMGVKLIEDCSFGDEQFIDVLADGFDVLCHHASVVENYKSPDFDVVAALTANTRNLAQVMRTAASAKLGRFVFTGSVFEHDEGAGTTPLNAFSPYGLSKGLTWQAIRYQAVAHSIRVGKFVIPNPFGPFEEPRFCAFLLRQWAKGEAAQVNTPDYVRDNIHVSQLARAYASYVTRSPDLCRLGPSGYVESQGAFASRFAASIGPRLKIETPLILGIQRDFPEPLVRINTDPLPGLREGDGECWDALAEYYRKTYFVSP